MQTLGEGKRAAAAAAGREPDRIVYKSAYRVGGGSVVNGRHTMQCDRGGGAHGQMTSNNKPGRHGTDDHGGGGA